MTFNSDM